MDFFKERRELNAADERDEQAYIIDNCREELLDVLCCKRDNYSISCYARREKLSRCASRNACELRENKAAEKNKIPKISRLKPLKSLNPLDYPPYINP